MKSIVLTVVLGFISLSSFADGNDQWSRVHSINCRGEMIAAAEKYAKEYLTTMGLKINQEKMYAYIREQQRTLGTAAGDLCVGMMNAAAEK